MAWPVYKPPSGIPASGLPARGGSATGNGWGGPAAGNGNDRPPRPRTAADSKKSAQIAADPVAMAEITRRKMAKEERSAELTEFLERVALNLPGENSAAPDGELALRVSAAVHALDRLEGKPQQTNKNLNVNVLDGLSTDDQRAVLEALNALPGSAGRASEGDAETHL